MRTTIFSADCSALDDMREFVAQAARDAGLDEKEVYAVQLATDEACTNIIEHAYQGIESGQVEITCNLCAEGLTIILHDHGRPFDPGRVPPPNLCNDLSRRGIGGLGLYIIRSLMDELRYETSPETGNVLTMTKRKAK